MRKRDSDVSKFEPQALKQRLWVTLMTTTDTLCTYPKLRTWHPDDGHQDDGNKDKEGISNALKEEWHDTRSVNTRETALRRDASDVEEAAQDEDNTATRGKLRDSGSLEDSDTEDFSQPETVILWSNRTGQSPDGGHEQGMFHNFLEKSRSILQLLRVKM